MHSDTEEQGVQITPGVRVRAVQWLMDPPGSASLAGVAPKGTARRREIVGVVSHIRGNDPVAPTKIGIWIVTNEGEEVVVPLEAVKEVLAGLSDETPTRGATDPPELF